MRETEIQCLVGKSDEKRQFGRQRRRWEDSIKMDLKEVECLGVEWINLAQDWDEWRALVNTVIYFLFSQNSGNFLNS